MMLQTWGCFRATEIGNGPVASSCCHQSRAKAAPLRPTGISIVVHVLLDSLVGAWAMSRPRFFASMLSGKCPHQPQPPQPPNQPAVRLANPSYHLRQPSNIRDLLRVRNARPRRPFSVPPRPIFVPFEHACYGASPTLSVQCASHNFVDRPRRITQRYVLAARAARMLALPALPASLISLKTKRAVWASVSAPRAHRRYPVVHPSLMLAVSANRHDSSIFIFADN